MFNCQIETLGLIVREMTLTSSQKIIGALDGLKPISDRRYCSQLNSVAIRARDLYSYSTLE